MVNLGISSSCKTFLSSVQSTPQIVKIYRTESEIPFFRIISRLVCPCWGLRGAGSVSVRDRWAARGWLLYIAAPPGKPLLCMEPTLSPTPHLAPLCCSTLCPPTHTTCWWEPPCEPPPPLGAAPLFCIWGSFCRSPTPVWGASAVVQPPDFFSQILRALQLSPVPLSKDLQLSPFCPANPANPCDKWNICNIPWFAYQAPFCPHPILMLG